MLFNFASVSPVSARNHVNCEHEDFFPGFCPSPFDFRAKPSPPASASAVLALRHCGPGTARRGGLLCLVQMASAGHASPTAPTRTDAGALSAAKTPASRPLNYDAARANERVCCLLVLNLVSSTLSCIRQPRPRLDSVQSNVGGAQEGSVPIGRSSIQCFLPLKFSSSSNHCVSDCFRPCCHMLHSIVVAPLVRHSLCACRPLSTFRW